MKQLVIAVVIAAALAACGEVPTNPQSIAPLDLRTDRTTGSEIVITRDNAQAASARFKDARIYLDNKKVALLSNAQRVSIAVDPGEHYLDVGETSSGDDVNGYVVDTVLKPHQTRYFRLIWADRKAQIYPAAPPQ